MIKFILSAALLALGACTNYATTATPEAKAAWERSLPSNGNGHDGVTLSPAATMAAYNASAYGWRNPGFAHDCPELDPAQLRCGVGQ